MIPVSEGLEKVLSGGSFKSGYVADLIVDGDVVLEDVPLSAAELSSNADAKIVTQGSVTVTYTDDLGVSIVPEDVSSWLSPFASFMDVSYRAALGDSFSEKVLRGRLKITGAADPVDRSVRREGRVLTVGSQVTVSLKDLFHVTDRERFIAPSPPASLMSVKAELARLTGLPIVSEVADAQIPRSVTYEENRLDAVLDLASVLGAFAYVNAAGALALVPKDWSAPVAVLRVGGEGSIVRVDADELSDDGVFNQVVVRSHDDSQETILWTEQLEDGPLRYGGPFGRVPFFASSQYVTTAAQARAYALSLLPQVSSLPAVTYSIQCLPDPRLEVWDVITVVTDKRTFDARISKMTLPGSGPMTLTVQVKP